MKSQRSAKFRGRLFYRFLSVTVTHERNRNDVKLTENMTEMPFNLGAHDHAYGVNSKQMQRNDLQNNL